MTDYNQMEMMISIAARELENGATVGVGAGLGGLLAATYEQDSNEAMLMMGDLGEDMDLMHIAEHLPEPEDAENKPIRPRVRRAPRLRPMPVEAP